MAKNGIFILGSTGPTGEIVTRELRAAGRHVVVMHRSDKRAAEYAELGAEVLMGDAMDRDSVFTATAKAAASSNVVLNLLGGMPFDSPDKWPDYEGTVNAVDAAEAAGIPTMVLMTSIGTGPSRPFVPDESFLIPILELKTKAEEHLRNSSLNAVILKPGGLGPPDHNNEQGQLLITENHGVRGVLAREELAQTTLNVLNALSERLYGKELYIASSKIEENTGTAEPFEI